MDAINVQRAGLAGGLTGAILSAICLLFAWALPSRSMIYFTNSIMHSIDVTSIARTSINISQALVGVVTAFVIGWLAGTLFAFSYNLFGEKKQM